MMGSEDARPEVAAAEELDEKAFLEGRIVSLYSARNHAATGSVSVDGSGIPEPRLAWGRP